MANMIRINKNNTGNFTIILNEIFKRNDISARAKGLYAYLMTLPDDWKVYKQEVFTHFTEGKNAMNTCFKELEKAGYISKEKSKNEKGQYIGWDYTIFESSKTDSMENRQSDKPKSVNRQLLSTDSVLSTDKKQKTNKQNSFDLFWEAYPNKKAKGTAEKAWLKLKVDQTLLDIILTAIEQHKQSKEWTADGGRYIPHPASWLNARRWEDEIGKQAEPTKSVDLESFKEWEQL